MNHPTPWKVEYNQLYPNWHPKSMPKINGQTILQMPQSPNITHPGDINADRLAHQITAAINKQ